MLKLLPHYQGMTRVPFIWHDPTRPPDHAVDPGLGSSIDISATILARASIQPFNGLQGRDLFTTPPPEAVIVEEDSQRVMTGFERPQRVRTLITERYRCRCAKGKAGMNFTISRPIRRR